MTKTRAYSILVVFAILLVGLGYAFFPKPVSAPTAQGPRSAPPPPPPEVVVQLAKSKGFSALISYTDRGFEPGTVTIKRDEAVRFTNNSSGSMWVAATGGAGAYPGTSACGGSSFDTCKALSRGEFWEFTFEKKGVWRYKNVSNADDVGIIVVE